MKPKLKAKAILQSRIILQAALCVEDLIEESGKEGGRPWICIVEDHMKALFDKPVIRFNKTITKQDIKRTKELNAKYKWE